MEDKIGVIDLGSNTFHLLVAKKRSSTSFETIYKERKFVGLAEKGIEYLSQQSIQKGIKALEGFKKTLSESNVSNIKIIGTAALRTAKNNEEFLQLVSDKLNYEVEVIDGEREADLIFKGVTLLHPLQKNHVIMDIGGGSVEFILVQNGKNTWSKSYNIGIGVLHNNFHHSEPISKKEIEILNKFLTTELKELSSIQSDIEIHSLIGASGSFEVVETMNGKEVNYHSISEVSIPIFHSVSSKIINASLVERENMDGLPPSRTKMIVVAMLLIEKVIEIIAPKNIWISPYALKEGVLSELI
ncbi:MAG: hypothetical protein P1U56_19290 [Saprospiraceae bacterium]|nr:hypothetical protein [Saprospiraceae bacterium]